MIRKYHNHRLQTNPWHRSVPNDIDLLFGLIYREVEKKMTLPAKILAF